MERNIYLDDDLEDFLKEKSDQYKLYPSDKVWDNINRSLHPKFRWSYPVLTILFLFTSIAISDHKYFTTVTKGDYSVTNNLSRASLPAEKLFAQNTVTPTGNVLTGNSEFATTHNTEAAPPENGGIIPITVPAFLQPTHTQDTWLADLNTEKNAMEQLNRHMEEQAAAGNSLIAQNNATVKAAGENKPAPVATNKPATDETIEDNVRKVLWAGEPFKRPRFSWQASFSPTLSYRRLTSGLHEITDVFRGVPYDSEREVRSVNDAVTHKPAFGAEAGLSLNYRVSNSFILKAGLQVSYSRYQVKATPIKYQQAVLAVTTDNHHNTDSITVMSSLMNFNGDGSTWYNNQYYQLSMPIGFEWQVLGTSAFKWNVAASAQPVFNFSNNVYLLSTDFRNYGQDPSLVRKWNVSAGIETFLSYNIGNSLKLQAGPQLRYQMFSSYTKQYPIKEYLIDLGFKVGFTKTIR